MFEDIKLKYPEKDIGNAEDLTGKIFGKWQVLYRTENNERNKTMWVCRCSCENQTVKPVVQASLKNGTSTSCGCERLSIIYKINDEKIHIRDEYGNIEKKRCFKCHEFLPLTSFYRSKYQKDGYSGECKRCQNESKDGRYNVYKKNAKKRNINFNLTKEEFYDITSKPCYYCNDYSNKDINNVSYSGVDRIDSSKGYEIDNIVPCCDICNKMKLDYSKEFFINHINKIADYMKEVI